MQRIKCIVSYDGTNFVGYQVQPKGRTVQAEIERVLKIMHKGEYIPVSASGRTDSGVHAVGQVIHFDTNLQIPTERWVRALNIQLPQDIFIKQVEILDTTFHARFNTIGKRYIYKMNTEFNVFERHYTHYVPYELNIEKMQEALTYVVGTHDFSSFCPTRTEKTDKVRTIYEADVKKINNEIIFSFMGDGFLHNMVRILVGTAIEMGSGKRLPETMKDIILAKDRTSAAMTAPGQGLYLWEVFYEGDF